MVQNALPLRSDTRHSPADIQPVKLTCPIPSPSLPRRRVDSVPRHAGPYLCSAGPYNLHKHSHALISRQASHVLPQFLSSTCTNRDGLACIFQSTTSTLALMKPPNFSSVILINGNAPDASIRYVRMYASTLKLNVHPGPTYSVLDIEASPAQSTTTYIS